MTPPPWPLLTIRDPLLQRDPGEASGHRPVARRRADQIGAEVDAPRREPALADGRVGGELDAALGDHPLGRALDLGQRGGALVLARARPDHHALAAHLAARLEDHAVRIAERRIAALLGREVEALDGLQNRAPREVEADHLLDVCVDQLVVADSRLRAR